ncbi:alkane 1-monooxygenase [uncultured Litoreibacter sp.]|uniref:alkane 1-monooxygenase n=1 Tax=uncultured Litoreibacter sp. TaxID=1392394 RepID=UPI002611836B|nr:alkane 1-monooxygenase [uncultured Litoreibacter sp.]
MATLTSQQVSKLQNAAPFWLALALIPVVMLAAMQGGWYIALIPLFGWGMFSVLDTFVGLNTKNADLETPEEELFWYTLVTLIWFPVQFVTIFGTMVYALNADHLSTSEIIWLFFGIGVVTGSVGINYSHELMHQKNRLERWLADLLLASVLYSHFRSEHLLNHHRYVATPKDPVTARYNEGFHRFFPRVLRQCAKSAWDAEVKMLTRKGLPATDFSNPFWRYAALQLAFLIIAALVGGWAGLGLFVFQSFVAIWQLELVNYIEHYGLTRKHLGDGKYEHVQPRHSWNAAQKASNWFLINLQRHSDHHYKPDRRFPLLQTYTEADAPQLPHGYPVMTMAAMVPPLFRRIMNPRVRKWRAMYYPEITDWSAYKTATNPMPR